MSKIGVTTENLTLQASGSVKINKGASSISIGGTSGFSSRIANFWSPSTTSNILAGYPVGLASGGLIALYSGTSNRQYYIGIALADSVQNTYIPVALPGAYVSGYTGLETGSKYYLGPSYGTISTTSNSTPVGIAVSSTTLMVWMYPN